MTRVWSFKANGLEFASRVIKLRKSSIGEVLKLAYPKFELGELKTLFLLQGKWEYSQYYAVCSVYEGTGI